MMNDPGMSHPVTVRLLQYLSVGAILIACKKPPEVATPTPVVVETVSEVQDESSEPQQSAGDEDGQSGEDVVQDETEEQSKNAEVEFADKVNNAVALLTGDDSSVQLGLQALQALQKGNETSPEVPYNIGVAQLQLENERAAQKSFERAIELDPTFSKAWFNLGVMLERQRKYEDAMAIYEEGLTHSETDPDLSAGKISCLRKMGRLEDAIVYAQEVLRKNANNVAAYSEVGAVYMEQGKLDKALFVLQQASARNGSENAKLQSVLGQVYYAQEKLPLAEQSFRKSLELDPTLIETAMYLSFLQLQNRAWSEASSTLEAALKYDPSNAALLNAHGVAKRGLGEIEEAERLYKEAYQLNPSNPEPLLNLAVLEADYRNEYTKAFELLDRYQDEGGADLAIVDTWRSEFKESEAAYLKEKKQQELRDLFRRRREEAAKKRAEEEARRAAEEAEAAEAAEVGEAVEDASQEDLEASEGATSDDTLNSETEDGPQGDVDTEGTEEGEQDPDDTGVSSDETVDDTDESEASEQEGEDDPPQETDNGWGAPVNENLEDDGEDPDDETGSMSNTDSVEDAEGSGADASDADDEGVEPNERDASDVEGGDTTDVESEPNQDNPEQDVTPSDGTEEDEQDDESADSEGVVGWGAPATTEACTVQSDCSDDKVCAATGECLYQGEFGTALSGEECSTSEQCAITLSCVESVCIQEETLQDDTE